MCGLAGFFGPSSRNDSELQAIAQRMNDTIWLRGPDSHGVWSDQAQGIALGHRRLSILDLSPEGHQPMVSHNGRFVIVFNGEVYNFQDLRTELVAAGHAFRGHSDTEIMLAAFCQWGVMAATKRFNGMFAFAVWDSDEKLLHLGRDRLGEKPLYYGWQPDGTLLFGSELKTFKAFPGFHNAINRDAIAGLLRLNYIADPHSIYEGVYKLPPAALLTWDGSDKRPALYDEPFSDYSQLPTFLVCQLARQHVTVALSGDAGDELFSGYERYFVGRSLWNKISALPPVGRKAAAGALTTLSARTINTLLAPFNGLLPEKYRHVSVGDKLHKLAEVLQVSEPVTMYQNLVSHWKHPEEVVINGHEPRTALTDSSNWPRVNDFTHRMMHLDMETYLPGDILTKVDRASMGVSLEGRIPLLDPRVIEFAWRIPLSMKVKGGQGKWLLRQVLYKHVPKHLIERPKMGFSVPLGEWLRGELRDWAEALLDESRLKREGYFHPAPIRQKWTEHLAGSRNWQYYLWDVLMFQAWLEAQKP